MLQISVGFSSQMKSIHKLLFLLLAAIVLVIHIPCSIAAWDPYEILGVKHDASLEQVKQSYRNLAKKLHPDKNGINDDTKRFIELQRAFDYIRDHKTKNRGQTGTATRVLWLMAENIIRTMHLITTLEMSTTALVLVICVGIVCLVSYHIKAENSGGSNMTNRSRENHHQNIEKSDEESSHSAYKQMKIIELKLETYNGMVRLLKPGQRSIVLLCDRETKEKLIKKFKKAVWPYRRNKTLLFGFLCLDRNLDWFRSILEEVLGFESLALNKRCCIGTVLSLNGFKKYFRLYHAKHTESGTDDVMTDGSFLGFEDNYDNRLCIEDAACNEFIVEPARLSRISVENLLDELPNWLEKAFEGLTKKYFLDQWPECMK